ncbi:MAG: hypothetical protein ACI9ZX_000445, partial [Algoriphagus sp.]
CSNKDINLLVILVLKDFVTLINFQSGRKSKSRA